MPKKKRQKKEKKFEYKSHFKKNQSEVDADVVTQGPIQSERSLAPAHVFIEVDDELTFILERISATKSKRMFLSATDGSSLLSSIVSMKLLQEKLDQSGKVAIVVTTDPLSAKISLDAGIMTVPTPDGIDESVWLELEEDSKLRLKKNTVKTPAVDKRQIEKNLAKIREKVEEDKQKEEKYREMDRMSSKEVDIDGFTMVVGGDILEKKKEIDTNSDMVQEDTISRDKMSESARRRLVGTNMNRSQFENDRGVDLRRKTDSKSAFGVDSGLDMGRSMDLPGVKKTLDLKSFFQKYGKIQYILPVSVVLVVIIVLLSMLLPRARVNLLLESIPVESTFEITADIDVDEIDVEDLVIPAIKEEEEESGSDSTSATGTGQRGDKATGIVTLYNDTDNPITVDPGTRISKSGLEFKTDVSVVVPGDPAPAKGEADVAVTAIEAGDEYNLPAGTVFTVVGISGMEASNAAVFAGGSSDEFTSVSKKDIDGLTKKIKEDLFEKGEEDIKDLHDDDKWILVEDSIKSEVDGEVQSDAKVGDEKGNINISIETITSAFFYNNDAMKELIKELFKKDVVGDKSDSDLQDFEVSEDLELDVTVKEVKDGKVELEVKAAGFLSPKIDSEKLIEDLAGKNKVKGLEIIKNLDFVADDSEVTFLPKWFPGFLQRFPKGKGRVEITTESVEVEDGGGISPN